MANIQLNSEISTTVFEKMLEPISSVVEETGNNLSSHHNEKYKFHDFFRLLVFYFVTGKSSINSLIKDLGKGLFAPELGILIVAQSTFKDGFERFDAVLFKNIFVTLLGTISLVSNPELMALGTLYCIDGSLFPVLNSMLWAEYRQNCKAVRLHLCFELNRMIAADIIVGSGNSSERDALRAMLKASVTYIADRGYQCFQLFHDIGIAQAYFVIRVKHNLQYTIETALMVDLPQKCQIVFREVSDQMVLCANDPHKQTYRLVKFCVGSECFLIMTNRLELSTFQVILLYAYRWQIELMFRFLKRTMNGIHIINHSQNGITIQFYMMLIVALLELKLKQIIWTQYKDEKKQKEKSTQDNKKEENPLGIEKGYQIFDAISKNLKSLFKVGIHWLNALKAILHWPFDGTAVAVLGVD